jgi:tetratricopeptide (TPR) repeat protein
MLPLAPEDEMKKIFAPFAVAAAALLVRPGIASASGPSPLSSSSRQELTPEREAVELYNDGISYRDKAAQLEKEAAAATDPKKKEKLEQKSLDKTESSMKKFMQATEKNSRLFQAWGGLGFAYRKIGKLQESLEAYNQALEIEKNYTPAIEYRAETNLGLARLEDVKSAYMILFNMDRPRAEELSAAIEKWLQKKQAEPGGLDSAEVSTFAKWAAERKQLASQTSSLLAPAHEAW